MISATPEQEARLLALAAGTPPNEKMIASLRGWLNTPGSLYNAEGVLDWLVEMRGYCG
jgi:hypothetical protein